MSAHTIRPASIEDVPAIRSIYEHAVLHGTGTFEILPPDEAEMAARFTAMTGQGYPFIVAEDAHGLVLGYAYANAFRARPAYRWSVEDSVYVAPDAKGRGVGGDLLTRLIEISAESGFRQMIAVVGDSGNAPSVRLHERAGFRMIGVFEQSGFKFGRWIDTVLMQMPLGAAGSTLPDETRSPGTLYQR
ncbi:GNAT family N-acetyltransferase [Aurantimonas sp. A3-2-R12]|uniref:GNAT family N-acetyltransferase n=1 Tax=Aurantimonas sp. A3-2-R12 TaxID=3114362 RepID=UPI002E174D0E|nr:GNAT family N-acetyltransferase [Aurantimonas sp. A3-2-R12]